MAKTRRRSSTSMNYKPGAQYGSRGNARGKDTKRATGGGQYKGGKKK